MKIEQFKNFSVKELYGENLYLYLDLSELYTQLIEFSENNDIDKQILKNMITELARIYHIYIQNTRGNTNKFTGSSYSSSLRQPR